MSQLQFNKGKSTVPLLLIHDSSGLINHYNCLMPLQCDLFALSNPCLITGGKWESVEQIAESYANAVINAKTDQIIIGGWSFGGVVAFEAAKRLAQNGVRVRGIVLIDAPCPTKHVPLSSSVIDHITRGYAPLGLNVPDWLQHCSSKAAVAGEWEALTQSSVKTWPIPGDHFSPFTAENIEQTSQQLKDACHFVERL
ncbi:alpha/beta-hydrolase [Suillus decipiens]|nr:alpha/beta-hydrolase [Suillus decipiens]